MKTTFKIVALLLFCFTFSVSGQQKLTKASQKINVSKDVNIDLNTSYVEIEIDTWNKNTLEIEAYIEDEKMTKEELQDALKNWDLKIEGSGDYVKISSEGSGFPSWDGVQSYRFDLEDLNLDLDALKNLEDINVYIADMPEMPEMPELPEMPEMVRFGFEDMPQVPKIPELPKGVNNVSFDTEAFEKDGEAYLEKWSKEFEEEYGKEFGEKMKAWGREMAKIDFSSYEKAMDKWGEKFGKDYEAKMAVWSKKYEESFDEEWADKMEVWEEKHGKQMEQRALLLEQRMAKREQEREARVKALEKRQEERAKEMEKRLEVRAKAMERRQDAHANRNESIKRRMHLKSDNVKKTIKIKMPKNAKLNMNVRHGELKIGSVIHNLRGDISHSVLLANHIDGSETSINVAYSPVEITTWSLGQLNLKYVEDAHIQNVNRLVLNSNSSDIILSNLLDNAIIDGSFGDLTISNIADSFSNLNIILENSDALISLPQSDYSVFFKGNRSRLNNEMTSQKTIENYTSGKNSGKSIVVNAKFSDVVLR
ncbi:hypothetical protein [Psychroserpens sp.]|uniref:hypothetical protein n=1 Tax=Psychroserpens sp. TaxID=2020870 RepID=UPI00385EFC9B